MTDEQRLMYLSKRFYSPTWSDIAKEKVGHVDRDRYDAISDVLIHET